MGGGGSAAQGRGPQRGADRRTRLRDRRARDAAGERSGGNGVRIWDCHSDVLSRLLDRPLEAFLSAQPQGDAPEDGLHCTLERLEAGGVGALVCALFTRDGRGEHPVVRTARMIDIAHRLERESAGRVRVATPGRRVADIVDGGAIALVLSIENGVACLEHIELLRTWRRLGVRAMGLVWNGRNAIADGCGEEETGGGLTRFGREVVDEMQRLGMLVDVSHLSESGFWDVLERARAPVIASHSNARALCEHPRNLRDEQIRAIAETGGVIGVNLFSAFLVADGARATIDDVVAHVHALLERAGEDAVGIGSDFDGIPDGPQGLEHPGRYGALVSALEASGLRGPVLQKILWGNFARVFGTAGTGHGR
ncbi:MAG: membrane dipeptidase [Planctomycetota bacterium]|nr:MAG: membrane dipeptidase [Planctomycetota bacterium]